MASLSPLEIACDESGYEGEKLVGGTTDVFAHASVRLGAVPAARLIQEIRDRIRSPALEYKSNHLLREKHRGVLTWLLGSPGPIHGHARVHLTDKTFFVVGRAIDLLVGEVDRAALVGLGQDPRARDMAVTLYRDGGRAFGREPWAAFLESANDVMRARNRRGARTSLDSFFRMVDVLRRAGTPGPAHGVMGRLARARPRADSFRAQLLESPTSIPGLDPLFPAIIRAVVSWGRQGRRPVAIIHDEHASLTERRIAQLKELFDPPAALLRSSPRVRLASLRLVDSRSDPRVQVADFLAGVARKIASDELNDRGDPELTALLRPYVDPSSVWADDRSWAALGPADPQPARVNQASTSLRALK